MIFVKFIDFLNDNIIVNDNILHIHNKYFYIPDFLHDIYYINVLDNQNNTKFSNKKRPERCDAYITKSQQAIT